MLTWQNLFKSSPDSYAKDAKNYLLINYLVKLGIRGFKQSVKNMKEMIKNKEEYN